ncbi:MAG: glycosyltransferase family 2 protein [Candidatus Omnitrophota bacterium]
MKCDIIIPVWNQAECTRRCVESVKKNTRYPYRLILIDNGSESETGDYLARLASDSANILLIKNRENLGFIKATNQGLEASDAPYACLMNNDAEATPGWLETMVAVAESDNGIGLVNPRSGPPGKEKSFFSSRRRYIETNQCMGYCMLIKREVLEKIGRLDEAFGVGGFDDTDFSKRAHMAGYKSVCAKDACVYHKWHTSFNEAGGREESVRENEAIFFNKWGRYLRIGYPIIGIEQEGFLSDMKTSLGLAREWNWVHAWLAMDKSAKTRLEKLDLPEHQSLRVFGMSGIRPIFCIEVLFRLIERRMKKRKSFDAVVVSDKRLFNTLMLFRGFFLTPVFYITGRGEASSPDDGGNVEAFWRERARSIADTVTKGRES